MKKLINKAADKLLKETNIDYIKAIDFNTINPLQIKALDTILLYYKGQQISKERKQDLLKYTYNLSESSRYYVIVGTKVIPCNNNQEAQSIYSEYIAKVHLWQGQYSNKTVLFVDDLIIKESVNY